MYSRVLHIFGMLLTIAGACACIIGVPISYFAAVTAGAFGNGFPEVWPAAIFVAACVALSGSGFLLRLAYESQIEGDRKKYLVTALLAGIGACLGFLAVFRWIHVEAMAAFTVPRQS
jgi:hypothetical protein